MNKKAMELPLNIVIMLIIGVVIFGLGLGLFSKIAGSSEDQIDDLGERIKLGIASLECDGEDWICIPKSIIEAGESKTFNFYVSNL